MLMTAMFTPGTTAPAWSNTTPLRVAVAPWAYTLFEKELIKVNESRRHTTSAINRADNEPVALIRRQTTHRHISLNLGMRVFSCEETLLWQRASASVVKFSPSSLAWDPHTMNCGCSKREIYPAKPKRKQFHQTINRSRPDTAGSFLPSLRL